VYIVYLKMYHSFSSSSAIFGRVCCQTPPTTINLAALVEVRVDTPDGSPGDALTALQCLDAAQRSVRCSGLKDDSLRGLAAALGVLCCSPPEHLFSSPEALDKSAAGYSGLMHRAKRCVAGLSVSGLRVDSDKTLLEHNPSCMDTLLCGDDGENIDGAAFCAVFGPGKTFTVSRDGTGGVLCYLVKSSAGSDAYQVCMALRESDGCPVLLPPLNVAKLRELARRLFRLFPLRSGAESPDPLQLRVAAHALGNRLVFNSPVIHTASHRPKHHFELLNFLRVMTGCQFGLFRRGDNCLSKRFYSFTALNGISCGIVADSLTGAGNYNYNCTTRLHGMWVTVEGLVVSASASASASASNIHQLNSTGSGDRLDLMGAIAAEVDHWRRESQQQIVQHARLVAAAKAAPWTPNLLVDGKAVKEFNELHHTDLTVGQYQKMMKKKTQQQQQQQQPPTPKPKPKPKPASVKGFDFGAGAGAGTGTGTESRTVLPRTTLPATTGGTVARTDAEVRDCRLARLGVQPKLKVESSTKKRNVEAQDTVVSVKRRRRRDDAEHILRAFGFGSILTQQHVPATVPLIEELEDVQPPCTTLVVKHN